MDVALFCALSVATTAVLRFRDNAKPVVPSSVPGGAQSQPKSLSYPRGPSTVKEAVARIGAAGTGALHILIDFDRTITLHWVDDAQTRPSMTSYGVLEHRFGPKEKAEVEAIARHFYAIETNPALSRAEKAPHMIEWHRQSNALHVAAGLTRRELPAAVAAGGLVVRPGVREAIEWCERFAVPFVIMSAGIGDVVSEALRQLFAPAPVPAVVHVVSNSLIFDSDGPDGRLAGFSEPILTVFNKSAAAIPQNGPLAAELRRRPHVIVVGDSTGDATMADGGGHETVLKLGLLNHDVEALLPRYSELFDAVVTGDAGLDLLLAWLREIEGAATRSLTDLPSPLPQLE